MAYWLYQEQSKDVYSWSKGAGLLVIPRYTLEGALFEGFRSWFPAGDYAPESPLYLHLDDIRVYDVSTHQWVFRIRNKGQYTEKIETLENLALSPNGQSLALQGDHIVRGYSVNAAPTAVASH
jgi:hypothetical protein